jgi:molecular chaperone GrpE (heat shock protein)
MFSMYDITMKKEAGPAMAEQESNDSNVPAVDSDECATACTVKEALIALESGESPDDQPFAVSEAEWTEIKTSLDKRYEEIATLLRYNKTREESIRRLSAEVQKYRDGFAYSALKPFINALITLREDCRKSIRDLTQFEFDDEKVRKYVKYLISDFEEMLTNIGLERDGKSISIKGEPLSKLIQPKALPEEPSADERKNDDSFQTLVCAEQIKSMPELIEYLKKSEEAIRSALQDRAVIDKTIQEYGTLAARTDAEHYFALIAPISGQLYKLCDGISDKSQPADGYSGDKLIKLYAEVLEDVVNGLGDILIGAGVKTETLDDIFDPQKHKLLKTVPTDEEARDRTIANRYTDCYTYEEKVIYPSKVDVYKFQQ